MKEFNIKNLDEAKTIVRWEIISDFLAKTLKFNQKKYVQDLLESKRMTLYNPIVFWVKVCSWLFLNQTRNYQQVDLTVYQQLVGKLMYLNYRTSPDFAFIVRQLNRYNSDLWVGHLRIGKQVLQYLNKTITFGIKWGKNLAKHQLGRKYGEFGKIGYADSSYIGDLQDKKSITSNCFFLGGFLIT